MNEKNRISDSDFEQVVGGISMVSTMEQVAENINPATLPKLPGEVDPSTLDEKLPEGQLQRDIFGFGNEFPSPKIGFIAM